MIQISHPIQHYCTKRNLFVIRNSKLSGDNYIEISCLELDMPPVVVSTFNKIIKQGVRYAFEKAFITLQQPKSTHKDSCRFKIFHV